MLTVYGIKNCDTVKKALKWLDGEGIEHTFHDLRADGVDEATVARWIDALGWESVLNRRSTTWRQLSETDKEGLNETRAATLAVEQPTLIKRPVFEGNGLILNGFTDKVRGALV